MATPETPRVQNVGGSIPPPGTISDLKVKLTRYLQEVELLKKPRTLEEAHRVCYSALPFLLDTDDLRSGVLAYIAARKKQGMEPRTLDKNRVSVCAFLKHAGYQIKISKIKFVLKRPEVYTQDELDLIFKHANSRDFWLFKLLLQAGLREQEAQTLEYYNVLDTGIQVTSHGSWSPKDSEERVVKVPRTLIDNLRQLPRIGASKLVFPSKWGNTDWHFLRRLKRTAKRAGLDPANCWLHKYRANFCTHLLRNNVPIQDVMYQMGHSSVKSTMRYMALLEDRDMQTKIENIWK